MNTAGLKKGFLIRSKDNGAEYFVTQVGSAMITYESEEGAGEVSLEAFDTEFEIIRPDVEILANVVGVVCPFCGTTINGFVGDPRGADVECEKCQKAFTIPLQATVKF